VGQERIWIAEKPSAAKDLAAGLALAFGEPCRRDASGLFRVGQETVLPLAGHLLESVRPGEYLSEQFAAVERARQFDLYRQFLPILPEAIRKQPRREVPSGGSKEGKVFAPYVLASKILKGAREIVNAGDIDREGQLIVDELLEHLGIDPYGSRPMVWRFGLASNVAADIAAAVKAGLERNSDPKWVLKSQAASTREYLDYCWGMNLSMVGQVQHRNARIAAGRVQTPVLALVDRRCREVDEFRPTTYYVPVVTLKDGTVMRWYKRDGAEGLPGFDAEGRITDESLARQIVQRIAAGLPGRCTLAKVTQHSEKQPLPFSLSSLQATASRELGLTLEQVGDCAKGLYQKHKAISYIGTDCKFLPESMHANAPQLLRALGAVYPKQAPGADARIKSPAFNDAKLDEHFAIVPTGTLPQGASADEMNVFRIVARRFIAQFYPEYVYRRHKIEGLFGADHFAAVAKQDVRLGWKEVEGHAARDGQEAEPDAALAERDEHRDKDQPADDVQDVA